MGEEADYQGSNLEQPGASPYHSGEEPFSNARSLLRHPLIYVGVQPGNNSTSKGDESLEQKAIQGRDEKYLTPCIESLLCNDLKAAPDVHLGHCWCCIFKGQCYSSEFICTVLCILPPNSATNETSHVP
eukprot:TRINITY_DN6600_c0_g1_i4.p1 TRINITY_DN6600_c0_g1~~TRINITY_DN6600_c0_g1_i4.p1  ORF type:complete len:129 (-),score=18.71 TRINITY_DN6600_c0_g1_i4:694-1080(-)